MRCPRLAQICFPICVAALALCGCGTSVSSMNPSTPTGPTGPAPVVAAMGVETNGVAPNRWIYAQFNEAMDPATINQQTFTVTDSGGKLVGGNVAYYASYDIAGFQPSPALQQDATYTVTLSTGVASAQEVHLASAFTDSITTRASSDTSPITVKSVSPAPNANCVSATTPITIAFNEGADVSTVNSTNITITGPNNEVIAAQISYDVATAVATLTPSAPLPSGNITVTVQNVADAAGVAMPAAYAWSFATTCNTSGGATGKEYLYANPGGNQDVYAYAIDSATGSLTPVPGMPFQLSTGAGPSTCDMCYARLLTDPKGRFLFYGFEFWNTGFGAMAVDAATGALASDDFLVLPSEPSLSGISTDPQGRFLFEDMSGTSGSNNRLYSAAVASDGQLSLAPGAPYSFPGQITQGIPAATDQFVYVSNASDTSKLYGFSVDQTTGDLSSASTTDDGVGATTQVVTPSGKFLYADQDNDTTKDVEIVGYKVNVDGSLTQLSQDPQQTPDSPATLLIMSPNGNFLYHLGTAYAPPSPSVAEIRVYAIDQNTGSLSLTAVYTDSRIANAEALAIDPAVKYVYIAENSNGQITLTAFAVDPTTGVLTPLPGPGTPFPLDGVQSMATVRPQ